MTATVTFVFCDMVGSTALQTQLGDDMHDEVRRKLNAALLEAVSAHRGVAVKSMGDGIMAVFTSSTSDAVACAVAMQRAVARLHAADPMLGLALRVGVSAGEAVSEDSDWFGRPVVEAARLCAAARPGQVLAADVVRLLVGSRGGHDFEPVDPMPLKGLPGLVEACEVPWAADIPAALAVPLPASLWSTATFVGRAPELDVVRDAWHDVVAGGRRAVFVVGGAGSGKSELAAHFAREVYGSGGLVLYGRADEELLSPYQPIADAIRWYASAVSADTLRDQIGLGGGELVRIVPSLAARVPEAAVPEPADSDTERRRLHDAVAALFTRASFDRPVLLVQDDLHLAAPAALAALEHLLSAAQPSRLMLLALYRPAGASASVAALASMSARPYAASVALNGLTVADIETLDRSLDHDAAQVIFDETAGHPARVIDVLSRLGSGGDENGDGPFTARLARALLHSCPYKGLVPFSAGDAELFFGRDDVVGGVLARLAAARLVVLTGPSGSGKSSVVAAGVIPALARSALPGSSSWATLVMTPGPRPMAQLAAALSPMTGEQAGVLLAEMEHTGVVRGPADGRRLLLVIDQFEELFTLCDDLEERTRFADIVARSVAVPGGTVSVIIAVRGDFYAESARYPALAEEVAASTVLLAPMDEQDLRSAIVGPAKVSGLTLEPGLVDVLVRDVAGEPGGLPLLSHALLETWRRRHGPTLTIAGYREAGGVRGAIAHTA
jgi:class 3 adenylate cyclase/energy-coupling factor transporter ATP-binding protein EcfA2